MHRVLVLRVVEVVLCLELRVGPRLLELLELLMPLVLLLLDGLEVDGWWHEAGVLLVHVRWWLVLQLLVNLNELLDDVRVLLVWGALLILLGVVAHAGSEGLPAVACLRLSHV